MIGDELIVNGYSYGIIRERLSETQFITVRKLPNGVKLITTLEVKGLVEC